MILAWLLHVGVRFFEESSADNPIDYQKVYKELLKTNYNFPYALVDQEENIKINIGWRNRAKKIMLVKTDTIISPSACQRGY